MKNELYEIESKRVLDMPLDQFMTLLTDLGYIEKSSSIEHDTYYSRNDVDYMETVECLRIRKREGFAEITYKPASSDSTRMSEGVTAKKETNVILADEQQADIAAQLFNNVGMVKLVDVIKNRQSFQKESEKEVIVALDTVQNAGVFVEIEVMGASKDEGYARLAEIEKTLKLEDMPMATKPYRDIVMEKSGV